MAATFGGGLFGDGGFGLDFVSGSGTLNVGRPSVSVGSATVAGAVGGTVAASVQRPAAVGVGAENFAGTLGSSATSTQTLYGTAVYGDPYDSGVVFVVRVSASIVGTVGAAMSVPQPTLAGSGGVGGGTGAAGPSKPTLTAVGTVVFAGTAPTLTLSRPTLSGSGVSGTPVTPIPINRPTASGNGSVVVIPPAPPAASPITIFTWIDPSLVEHQLSGLPDLEIIQGRAGLHMPPVKISEDSLPGQAHGGSRLRDQVYGSREIDLPLFLRCQDYATLWARHSEISSWFRLRRDSSGRPLAGRLRVKRPDGSEREINCIYSQGLQGAEAEGTTGSTYRRMILVLQASDPLWYARNPTVLVFSIVANSSTFFSAPFLPLKLGASSVATGAIANNPGEEICWPVWQIVGPGVNPVLTNVTTGEALALTLTLTSGQSVTIDTRPTAKSVVNDQTSASLYSALAPGSATMWPLQPGSNNIQVLMGGATAASRLNLNFLPAFLGA